MVSEAELREVIEFELSQQTELSGKEILQIADILAFELLGYYHIHKDKD